SLLMAQCSLGGIWWARTRWPAHAKTFVAIATCFGVWILLLTVLKEGRGDPARAAGWSACLVIQATLAGTMSLLVELLIDYGAARPRSQLSIGFLLVWTSVVAIVLGNARWWARRAGWTLENFFTWDYFWQVQTFGVGNAALAVALLACTRAALTW